MLISQGGYLVRLILRLCLPAAAGLGGGERGAAAAVLLRCLGLGLEHHAVVLEREEVSTVPVAELAVLPPAGLAAAGLASLGARAAVMNAARAGCARRGAAVMNAVRAGCACGSLQGSRGARRH